MFTRKREQRASDGAEDLTNVYRSPPRAPQPSASQRAATCDAQSHRNTHAAQSNARESFFFHSLFLRFYILLLYGSWVYKT